MTTIESITTTVERPGAGFKVDDAQLAAVSFLARYSGRTLEAYRHDLRGYFQWPSNSDVDVLKATRPHIELFRAWMEDRGLAASTIDRRLSTVCGFYRFAHIDGRIGSNPAQYVRRPRVHPTDARGLDRSELGVFLFTAEQYDRPQAVLAVLLGLNGLRVSEACATKVEDLGFERGHRTLHIIGKGNKPATIPLVPRTARTIDLAVGERHEGPILQRRDGERLDRRTAHRWIHSIGKRAGLGAATPTCSEPRSSWLPSTRASRSETYSSPPATPTLAPPRSMTVAARTSTATPPTWLRTRRGTLDGQGTQGRVDPKAARAVGQPCRDSRLDAARDAGPSTLVKRLDEIIRETLSGTQYAVKWKKAYYGLPDQGWIIEMVAYDLSVKVVFFGGADFDPPPPLGTTDRSRYIKVKTLDELEQPDLHKWIEDAGRRAGWT